MQDDANRTRVGTNINQVCPCLQPGLESVEPEVLAADETSVLNQVRLESTQDASPRTHV